ncbi:olfactory receptor 1G1-like [Rhinophrynus dorsalis]
MPNERGKGTNHIPVSSLPEDCQEFRDVFDKGQAENKTMEAYVADVLSWGFIRKSSSPAGAGFFFVKDKIGEWRPFEVSETGVVTLLSQHPTPESLLHPFRYFSKKLSPAEYNNEIGNYMKENKSTLHGTFYLLGFTRAEVVQLGLFFGILLMYLLATLGNMMITTLICFMSQLHTPMYFFLCNLAIQDMIYVSTILPKFMDITITGDTSISFPGCITQFFVFDFCVGTEFSLLTSMAYDRYVAICIPLHYSLIMNKKFYALIASTCWIVGALHSLLYSLHISHLSFYNYQEINHFFCDPKTVLKLSWSDTTDIKILMFVDAFLFGFLPFVFILTSYAFIISTILKIQTLAGRLKTFSSCSSHLTIVILFFGSCLSLYLKPESKYSEELDKLLSLLYIALVPMLNPLVYSLRNEEVLKAMKGIYKT